MNSQDLTDVAVQLKATAKALGDLGDTVLPALQAVESNIAILVTKARDHMLAARAAAGITNTGGGSSPASSASVAAFFSAYTGKKMWLDPTNTGSLFLDTAAASALSTPGQLVGRINDISGGGNHAIQSVATKRPAFGQEGGLSYISGDGVDDGLYTASSLDLTSTNKLTLIVGLRKRNADATTMIAELGPEFTTGGAFGLYINQAAPQSYFSWGASGTQNNPTPIIASNTPDLAVLTCQLDLSKSNGWSMRLQRNNDTVEDPSEAGNRNLANAVLNLMCRNKTGLFSAVDIYSFMLLGGDFPSTSDLLMLRSYAAAKTGVTL